jgi:hypothetical protein
VLPQYDARMTFKHLGAALTLAFTMGCGGGGGGDFEAFLKLDSEKAVAFSAGGDDCVAKAKSVGDWRKANTANYKAMQKKLNDQFGKEPPKDLMEKHGTTIKANKKAVMDAMFKCSSNEAFGKMMDETKDE